MPEETTTRPQHTDTGDEPALVPHGKLDSEVQAQIVSASQDPSTHMLKPKSLGTSWICFWTPPELEEAWVGEVNVA
jgi:hypothetical protein